MTSLHAHGKHVPLKRTIGCNERGRRESGSGNTYPDRTEPAQPVKHT